MAQLDHINMTVEDLKKSIQWYKDVFNFEKVEEGTSTSGNPYSIIRSGDSMLCLYESKNLKKPSESQHVHRTYHFGLRITDRAQWESTIKDKRVIIDHTWQYPHSYSWYLFDPSGHEIEVVYWNENTIDFN